MNNFIIRIRLSKAQIINEYFLEEDEKILKSSFDSENKKSDIKEVIIFDEKKDYELVRVLEDVLLILLFFKIDVKVTVTDSTDL